MSIDVDISGMQNALRKLDKYKSSATKRLEDAVNKALVNVERGAKKRAPVDTGRLRSSIHITQSGTDGIVYTNVEYAPYIEFGTGTGVDIPEGQEDVAEEFKGEGIKQVNRVASPFLFPAWEEERPKFIKRIRKALGKLATKS